MPDLLIELFSEEIPARMQARASSDLKRLMTDGLVDAGLTYASAQAFATPRRLALTIEGLLAASPAQREVRRGPRVDAPDKAIDGFLRSTGLTRSQLSVQDDKKGQVYVAEIVTPGRPAAEIVAELLATVIRGFPWPKSMRWGAGALRWVRPLQSILCILTDEAGAQIVPLEIDGLRSTDQSQGHRFMAPQRFAVTSFDDYTTRLARAHVILDPTARAEAIWHEVGQQAFARGLEPVDDRGLLAEIAGLVEWPVVLAGGIGEDFLALPPEVLQTSMKEHQKFFSLRNAATGRIEGFATVANIDAPDGGETILRGNRKVLAARLSDAKFFWENDLAVAKGGMTAWLESLADVTFERRLGSQADRITRMRALAREIAPTVGADPDLADEAARVAKADLVSEMVYEFPELQGTMGRYYAEAAGLAPEIAAACKTHYSPLGPSDDVPVEATAIAVALADKLDLLTGFWAINEKPTGSKDPFALRRAALGVIRIAVSNGLRLRLFDVLKPALRRADADILRGSIETSVLYVFAAPPEPLLHDIETWNRDEVLEWLARSSVSNDLTVADRLQQLNEKRANVVNGHPEELASLLAFLHDRLKVHLKAEGLAHDVIDSVLAMPGADDLTLVVLRARALAATLQTEDGPNLVQGFKRANNILTQAEQADGVEYSYGADPKFAETDAERALFSALDKAEAAIEPAMKAEDFTAAMQAMAALRAPLDAFFETVQVNADNAILRRNRLNLMSRIRDVCLQVADLRKLNG